MTRKFVTVPEYACPHCGAVFSKVSVPESDGTLENSVICTQCGGLLIIDGQLCVRRVTREEVREMMNDRVGWARLEVARQPYIGRRMAG